MLKNAREQYQRDKDQMEGKKINEMDEARQDAAELGELLSALKNMPVGTSNTFIKDVSGTYVASPGNIIKVYVNGKDEKEPSKRVLGEDERIGLACTQLYKDGLIESKHDFAAVFQVIVEKIREGITYESLAKIIGRYAELPDNRRPSANDLKGESFKGDYPNWVVVEAGHTKTKHYKDIAARFLEIYKSL